MIELGNLGMTLPPETIKEILERENSDMNITEYHLKIIGTESDKYIQDTEVTKELIYRGNENIMIKCTIGESIIHFPKEILKKFIEIIELN